LDLWEAAERVDAPLERARAHERYMRPEAFAASLVAVFNSAMSYGGQPSTAFSATPRWVFPTWRGSDTPVVFSVVLADKSGMRVFTFEATLSG